MLDKAVRAHQEAEKAAVAVYFLDTVEDTADHIVTAGSLATAQNHAYIDRLVGGGIGVLLKADFGQAVGVGE